MKKLTKLCLALACAYALTSAMSTEAGAGITFGIGGGAPYGGFGYGYPYYGYGWGGPGWAGYGYYPYGYGYGYPGVGVGLTIPVDGGYSQPRMWVFRNSTGETITISSSTGSVTIKPGQSRSLRRPRRRRGRSCVFTVTGRQSHRKSDFGSCNSNIEIVSDRNQFDIQ